MVPDCNAISQWLAQLETDRLVGQSPRLLIEAETLRRTMAARDVHDLVEMSHSFASLLGKDRRRWKRIASHFLEYFGDPTRTSSATPLKSSPEPTGEPTQPVSPGVFPWIERIRQFVAQLRPRKRRSGGKTRVSIVIFSIVLGVFTIVNGVARVLPQRPAVAYCRSGLHLPPAKVVIHENQWSLEPLQGSVQGLILQPATARVATIGSSWLQIVLALFAVGMSILAARWKFAADDYAEDCTRVAEKVKDDRNKLLRQDAIEGIPYHIERVAPMSTHAIDDAATLLGRIARNEEGSDLDVAATIDQTIKSGGRVVPIHARGRRREAIIMLVDIEEGEHPYLDSVEWILERWQRLGVKFIRYDYRDRPENLLAHLDRRPMTPEALARSAEGAPLLIWSRMALPQDYDGKLRWLRALAPWPVRAWIDLDPRHIEERPRNMQRTTRRIGADLSRFSCTSRGLVATTTFLSSRGGKIPSPSDDVLKSAEDPDVVHALHLWAAAACCVPDPTWAHLDSLRRHLPEIATILPDRRYVQRLIDWINARQYGEGGVGFGSSMRFRPGARIELIAWLREFDAKAPNHSTPSVEHRARELLIMQLAAAEVDNDDFEKTLRDMKMRVHQAILDPSKAEEVLEEFSCSAVAPELRELLVEELDLQARGAVLRGSRGWSGNMRLATNAWVNGKGVRIRDLLGMDSWNRTRTQWALGFVALVATSWGTWWMMPRQTTIAHEAMRMTGALYRVVEERHVALRETAPMPFVMIPQGQFPMGSPETESPRNADESPQHLVHIEAFEIALHEVTQKQWEIVMRSRPWLCTHGCGDEFPVQNVSWFDAIKFMNRLTDLDNIGKPLDQQRTRCYDETKWSWNFGCSGYRLPTEAEWEYVARAGSTTAFDFGNDIELLCSHGNGADLSARKKYGTDFDYNNYCDDEFAGLAPVGSFRPNAWGVFDLHGNVYEWVWDTHHPYTTGLPPETSSSYAPNSAHVLRGGSFLSDPSTMRSAYRRLGNPATRNLIMGLRCARNIVP